MASERLTKITERLRSMDGTPLGLLRDGLLIGVGRISDGFAAVRARITGKSRLHPLLHVIARQIGEPTERWPISDVVAFRAKFESLTAFLPSKVRGNVTAMTFESVGVGEVHAQVVDNRRKQDRAAPAQPLVYLHGGGFVLGSSDSVLPEADELSRLSGRRVIVVDYPLSPEAPFPVAAKAVTTFLLDLVKGEPAGFAIAGESAGANLAIASLLEDAELREACRSVTLLYPFLDLSLSRPSVTELGEGYFLTKKMLEWFVKSYLREGADPSDPGASPIFASGIAELPPTLIIVGEFDPLLDDAREAHRLIPGSELKVVPGMLHGFLQMRKVIGARAKYLRIIGNFIARH